MGHANQRNGYWTARFATAPRTYEALIDPETGKPKRFKNSRDAKKEADKAEIEFQLAHGRPDLYPSPVSRSSDPGDLLFQEWAERWYRRQDLVENTMSNYRNYLECHLLPAFGETPLNKISRDQIAVWEKEERGAGNKRSSISQWRGLLYTVLQDACEEYVDGGQLLTSNPATRKRGRGRRTSRRPTRQQMAVLLNPLQALLIAERMALMTGRDDEFVWEILARWTGMRSGELHGLETRYLIDTGHPRRRLLRVEWQLAEVRGKLIRTAPKDESRRNIDVPLWLWDLLTEHIQRTNPTTCTCHGFTYVFSGNVRRRSARNAKGVTMAAIAKSVGVSACTVSSALKGTGRVSQATRERVFEAADQLGFQRPDPDERVPHWTRSSFREWVYFPAVTGRYPANEGLTERPVPIDAAVFPGTPVKGPHANKRAGDSWPVIITDARPHRDRHSVRTDLEEAGIPKVLIDERLGHEDGSVQANYTHITDAMCDRICDLLSEQWFGALDARLALCPSSPVRVLNELLKARADSLDTQAA